MNEIVQVNDTHTVIQGLKYRLFVFEDETLWKEEKKRPNEISRGILNDGDGRYFFILDR